MDNEEGPPTPEGTLELAPEALADSVVESLKEVIQERWGNRSIFVRLTDAQIKSFYLASLQRRRLGENRQRTSPHGQIIAFSIDPNLQALEVTFLDGTISKTPLSELEALAGRPQTSISLEIADFREAHISGNGTQIITSKATFNQSVLLEPGLYRPPIVGLLEAAELVYLVRSYQSAEGIRGFGVVGFPNPISNTWSGEAARSFLFYNEREARRLVPNLDDPKPTDEVWYFSTRLGTSPRYTRWDPLAHPATE